jgi:FkbM family methyltransferase
MGETKSRLEQVARERFFGSRLFPSARNAYQFFFNRQKYLNRRSMLRFYRPFIRQGSLVFDVGANVGIYTEVFAALGARVIAMEPNPRCCRILEELAQREPVIVEPCAAADVPGRMTLQVCENHLLSALAPTLDDAADRSPVHRAANWIGAIEVDVKTLDQIAKTHGVPSFVKIDAEGFDDRVLRGMSFQPDAVTFEYYRHLPDVARRCLEAPVLASGYRFNYAQGAEMKLASSAWLEIGEFKERLDALARGGEEYGDVIARKTMTTQAAGASEVQQSGPVVSRGHRG